MIRPDPRRLARRTKALVELSYQRDWYARRCERQAWPSDTPPHVLAHHEIATEQTVELLAQEVPV